jgi:PD-(D/E)XK nuclease superfamily protein
MTTDQKGTIAETAIVHAAAKLGIGVFKPLTDGERYDLIFDLRPKLIRVQCKWAARRGDTVAVRFYSCRRSSDGLVKRAYSPDEVDAFAAFCVDVDHCYFFPSMSSSAKRPSRCVSGPLETIRSLVSAWQRTTSSRLH